MSTLWLLVFLHSDQFQMVIEASIMSLSSLTALGFFFPLLIEILQPPFVSAAPVRQAEAFTHSSSSPRARCEELN